jgi:hypothetical protein
MSYQAVPEIDPVALARTVRRALKRGRVEIGEWRCAPLHPGFSGAGVYRCSGTGQEAGQPVPWSLILKVPHRRAGEESSAFCYWKREALVYQSGLLASLPGGLAAPQCFSVEERPDGSVCLWLEDIRESVPGPWSPAQYEAAAHHLGVFNGAYRTGRPLPVFSWLTTGWLRAWVAQFSPLVGLLQSESTWQNPLIRAAYPVSPAADLLRLWADREPLLAALDRLPRTLCHLDAWRNNLLSRVSPEGEQQTVAIDWAFTGLGAIGEEINALAWGTLGSFELEPEEARALDTPVFEGYLAGLREGGWQGDARQARFGYAASAPLRYGLISGLFGLSVALGNDHGIFEQRFQRPMEDIMKFWAAMTHLLLDLAEEARELLPLIA